MKPRRRLKVGDTIPDFWTRDINGGEIDSRDLKKDTLIVFLRYAGCPFCNLAVYRLAQEHKLLQKNGCDVLVFIQSTEDNIERHVLAVQDRPLPFPVIADQAQDFYRMFGVYPNAAKAVKYTAKNATHWIDAVLRKKFKQTSFEGAAFVVPAYFLTDKEGSIRLMNYDANFYEDAVFTPIYEQLTVSATKKHA